MTDHQPRRHKNPAKTYRPIPEEHTAAVAALPEGKTMDGYLRACLRLLAEHPEQTLALVEPYWPETRRGRPPKD